jgi:hypothetical protein
VRSSTSKAALFLLALILATGCHKARLVSTPSVLLTQTPSPNSTPPPSPDSIHAALVRTQVGHAAALLSQLPNAPQNAIPDAVLNGGQCLIVAAYAEPAEWHHVLAFISCRTGNLWGAPGFLILSLAMPHAMPPGGEVSSFLWIANSVGSQAIRERIVQRVRFEPGPMERQSPVLAQSQLTADIFSYAHVNGRLSGSPVIITDARDDNGTASAFYSGDSHVTQVRADSENTATEQRRFVSGVTSFFNTITPAGILIHHSGLIPIKVAAQLREQAIDMIDEFHARRGFEIFCFGRIYHVGYHYLILPDGKVETGRPERCEGAHARGYNSFIGIALVGDFIPASNPSGLYGPSTPTHAQMRSLVKLCRRLRWRYHIPIQRVMRHSDVTSTYCPGSRFPIQALLRALEKRGPS